jgi:uncharacterized protein (TIGR00297 family)
MALSAAEAKRKLLHMAVGGFALLLRWLTWPQAAALAVTAFLFNWQVLPRIGGRSLWRDEEHAAGYTRGMLLYPLSVLGLVLVFRHELWIAAAAWAFLAWGDGMAAFVGQALHGPRLPWNARKGWIGLAAFVLCGALTGAALVGWTLKLPPASWFSPWILALVVPAALLAALAESAPTTLDDNLTVPLIGGLALGLLALAEWPRLFDDPGAPGRLAQGLMVNAVVAGLAYAARSIDVPGALSAVLIGTLVTLGTGLPGFALLGAFFVVGSAVTKLGYRIKAARGIAQEKGGARGWRNAWANGGVPCALALLAGATGDRLHELFVLAYAASVATAAADTCSSEVGKAYGRRTFLITTLRPVPPGTEGAVSLEGTLGGFAGGLLVAAVGAVLGLYSWPAALLVGFAGLLGSLAESVIGTVAERRGWLDNDLLNATNTALGAALGAGLAHALALA